MALLGGGQRRATVTSSTQVAGLRIENDALRPVLQKHPKIADAFRAVYDAHSGGSSRLESQLSARIPISLIGRSSAALAQRSSAVAPITSSSPPQRAQLAHRGVRENCANRSLRYTRAHGQPSAPVSLDHLPARIRSAAAISFASTRFDW